MCIDSLQCVNYNGLVADDSRQKEGGKYREMPKLTLTAARVNAGYSQGELAEKLKVSRATVNAWECGRVKMKPHHLYAFCYATGVSEDDISLPEKST